MKRGLCILLIKLDTRKCKLYYTSKVREKRYYIKQLFKAMSLLVTQINQIINNQDDIEFKTLK